MFAQRCRTRSGKIYKRTDPYYGGQCVNHSRSRLAIAFTSREIYTEAASIYYGKNWFRLIGENYSALKVFAKCIGHKNRQLISVLNLVSVWCKAKVPLHVFPYRKLPFPCLKRLEIVVGQDRFMCKGNADFLRVLAKFLRTSKTLKEVDLLGDHFDGWNGPAGHNINVLLHNLDALLKSCTETDGVNF